MRIRPALAAVLVPALLLAACGDDGESDAEDGAQEQADDAQDAPGDGAAQQEATEVDPAEVDLLEAGQTPRRQLRLALEEGTEMPATLTFEEQVQAGEDASGEESPPQSGSIDLLLTVSGTDDGRATITFVYEDFTMEGAPEEQQPEDMEGMEGELVVDDRARVVGASELAQGLQQLLVPLPEEEVGEGAVWEVVTEGIFELPADEVMTVELASLDDEGYELRLSSTTEGPDEPTELPGADPEARMTLEELTREGTGQQQATLAEPFPVSSTRETETMLRITASEEMGGEQTQRFREALTFERR